MRTLHRQIHILLLMVATLLLFSNPIECIDGSLRNKNKLVKSRQPGDYQLRATSYQYQDCADDLFASDLNGDLKVGEDEYVTFIATRSQGAIDVGEYSSLPFPLISNFVYGSCFCFFVLKIPNCCVGAEAGINIDPDQSPFFEDNIITICRTTDEAIGNDVRTRPPLIPQTASPSFSPNKRLTPEPTTQLTEQPSEFPTHRESETPSSIPTNQPTPTPTNMPSPTPTNKPTPIPTNMPTPTPSNMPTPTPTNVPTPTPTNMPTPTPTNMPTPTTTNIQPTITIPPPSTAEPTEPVDLLCLSFQYAIENDEGLTADDIENGVNNTFKSDLIIATRNITIQVLNETLPRDQEGRALRRDAAGRPRSKTFEENQLLGVVHFGRFALDENYLVTNNQQEDYTSSSSIGEVENMQGQRRAVFLTSNPEEQTGTVEININNNNSMDNNRQLAFYADSYPPVISNIFDNPLCPESEKIVCSVVDTRVCVILEEGDDEDEVKDQLLDGIKSSFRDGSFKSAVPTKDGLI